MRNRRVIRTVRWRSLPKVCQHRDDSIGQVEIRDARARARLLQHQSLTNWVFVQRTLIHLSQMLEIIATGGRLHPTYGKGDTADTSGNLVDQEA